MNIHAIQNFNIPVIDIERAVQFYSSLLEAELQRMEFGDTQLGIFPFDSQNHGVGGALVQHPSAVPSEKGTIVYLNIAGDMNSTLSKVERLGGRIVLDKYSLGHGNGFTSEIIDSEGNKVGLYSKE
jgi:predicted enzyme related to lactoylglutathione lyase